MAGPDKAAGAFRTIGEVSRDTGLPQHILRYWETRFAQLRPLQRAGNRRYYRPADVALVQQIDDLLHRQGYTIRGVQQLLAGQGGAAPQPTSIPATAAATGASTDTTALAAVRTMLADALAAG